jgi:hypothetical protein
MNMQAVNEAVVLDVIHSILENLCDGDTCCGGG